MSMFVTSWIADLREKYKTAVANAFILTGNIGDYIAENKDLKQYLCEFLTLDGSADMRMAGMKPRLTGKLCWR